MKHLRHMSSIQVLAKDERCDWRAFADCSDEDGDRWELRGYGTSAGEAAQDAYQKFQEPTDIWDLHGYIIPGEKGIVWALLVRTARRLFL